MARGRSSGFGSSCSTIRYPFQVQRSGRFANSPVHLVVRVRESLVLLLALLCLTGWLAVPGFAQDDDQDVHIVPREAKKPDAIPTAGIAVPPGVIVDPSLKTHTKPFRKDVDLSIGSRDHHRSDEPAGDWIGEREFSADR